MVARRRLAGALGAAARGLDLARRIVLNVVFLALVVALAVWLLRDGRPRVASPTALVVAPTGVLVEQLTGDPDELLLIDLLAGRPAETRMRDLLEAVAQARDDERVRVLVLDLDGLAGGGLSKLQELTAALRDFRRSGKKVVAVADAYLQSPYLVAAAADEIVMHPMGLVLLTGFGSYRSYYKEAIDRLSIDWNVFRVGENKSAVEPYIRRDMSPEDRESRREWLAALWRAYLDEAAAARGLEPEALDGYAARLGERLEGAGGDGGRLALEAGLVDRVAHPDEVRAYLGELLEVEEGEDYPRIDHAAYLRAVSPERRRGTGDVAVLTARGEIFSGERPPGQIGADTVSRFLVQAREDDDVRALVLRIDSPGGNAFASELIRRELEITRQAGKPVVVSMGSVAASGGYWIASAADEIWASPTTLTGSIGIYAMLPTFQRTLERIGITSDGVGTGPLAGTLRPERDLPDQARRALEALIEQGYELFLDRVAEGRGLERPAVDAIARGKVWTGARAAELGLVDHLGGLEQAIAAAAERAGLGDDYGIRRLEAARGLRRRLIDWLLARTGGALPGARAAARAVDGLLPAADPSAAALLWAHCRCEPEEWRGPTLARPSG